MSCKNENIKIYNDSCVESGGREYVLECEAEFEEQLDSAVKDIADRLNAVPDTRIITLSRPDMLRKNYYGGENYIRASRNGNTHICYFAR